MSPERKYVAQLIDAESLDVVSSAVPGDAIEDRECRDIYAACVAVAARESKAGLEDVAIELRERRSSVSEAVLRTLRAELGGLYDLATCRREVLRAAQRRHLVRLGREVAIIAEGDQVAGAMERIQSGMDTIRRLGMTADREALTTRVALIEQQIQHLGDLRDGVTQNRPRANVGVVEVLSQVHPGALVVIGGYSHARKSFFQQFLERAYLTTGHATLRLSLEDPEAVNAQRVCAELTGLDYSKDFLTPEEAGERLQSLGNVYGDVAEGPTSVIITPRSRDVDVLVSYMRRAVDEHDARVVFVDYAQLITVAGVTDPRVRVATGMARIKEAAQQLGVMLVVTSQLRKPPGGSKNHEPGPEALKEASELHHAAEVLVLCWVEEDLAMEAGKETLLRSNYGKVAKDKITGRYPRFEFKTGPGGVIVDVVDRTESSSTNGGRFDRGSAWAGRGNSYADR